MRPRKRIGVVDGSEISRDVRCFVLDIWGYHPIPYRNVTHALRLYSQHRIDALIFVLPSPQAVAAIKKNRPKVKVMILGLADGKSIGDVSLCVRGSGICVREALRMIARHKTVPKMATGISA